jgi:hypothetical protein
MMVSFSEVVKLLTGCMLCQRKCGVEMFTLVKINMTYIRGKSLSFSRFILFFRLEIRMFVMLVAA